jgi:hypothetical protein
MIKRLVTAFAVCALLVLGFASPADASNGYTVNGYCVVNNATDPHINFGGVDFGSTGNVLWVSWADYNVLRQVDSVTVREYNNGNLVWTSVFNPADDSETRDWPWHGVYNQISMKFSMVINNGTDCPGTTINANSYF